jgi:arginase
MTSNLDCLIGVPYDCSGRFVGCERMPAAMRAEGVASALGLQDLGNLQVTIAGPVRDPEWRVIGLRDLRRANLVIRDAVDGLLTEGRHPLVLEGDCTLLIGVVAALQSATPQARLAFVDGHLDCYDGASSPTGEGADMELAIPLGRGARPLTHLTGRSPLIDPERVISLGPVDEEEAARLFAPDPHRFAPAMQIVDGAELAADPAGAAHRTLDAMASGPDGFWLHLDVDVLSAAVMPAVDYPQAEGLDWNQLTAFLSPLVGSTQLLGADVTIYNPTSDPDGSCARRLVRLLTEVSGAPAL